ncbi:unnamed protein product [Gongylonema pulchrum]|uniref:RAB3GAP2_N domain-containing protein n=1 Tax=Gongylonema pulchrum TaxID=637853 RepID=A0A183EGG9_9BILA|nr:unnamed protein product [Gongylonema pulchrum]
MFEKIRCMCVSPYGVWIATAHSRMLQLWKDKECIFVLDVDAALSQRRPSDERTMEITSVMYLRQQVWVGTVDGYLFIYRIVPNQRHSAVKRRSALTRKWSNHRRSQSMESLLSAVQTAVFLPSKSEVRQDESASKNEHRFVSNFPRKASLMIDRNSRKYSVFRKISGERAVGALTGASNCEPKRTGTSNQLSSNVKSSRRRDLSFNSLHSSEEVADDEPLSQGTAAQIHD